MPDFQWAFNQLSPLDSAATEALSNHLSSRSYEKGELIVRGSSVCDKLYFINHGLVKVFFNSEEKEFIMRFFTEQTFFTVLDSFTTRRPSVFSAIALERTEVTYIHQRDLETVCGNHHCAETAFRNLLSFAVTMMMKRVSEMLEENATARYNHFVRENGHLLQRISLGDLASYLGITQVSLSRIRSKK